ncbi:MAG: cupin domain-containing protein [Gemmatimonadales bacterium]
MKALRRGILVVAVVLFLPAVALAQQPTGAGLGTHAAVTPDKVTFTPLEIPGFDPGVKIAPIHGDPNAESGTYVVRLWFPDGYKFPPHWHPMAEHVTVLDGELQIAMGDKRDESKLVSYKEGSFLYIPGKMPHFGGSKGTTTIQLHGQAPFKIELANPMK